MSRKINPILFKLGVKNQWNFKFIEKKIQESSFFNFILLEINKFFELIIKKSQMKLVNLKLYFKKFSIHVVVTYTYKNFQLKQLEEKIKNKSFNNFNHLKTDAAFFMKNSKTLKLFLFFKQKIKKLITSSLKLKTYFEKAAKQNLSISSSSLLKKRLFFNKFYNIFLNKNKNLLAQKHLNYFINTKLATIKHFLKGKTNNLSITFKQLDKSTLRKITLKTKKNLSFKILNLKKFEKLNYYNTGLNLIYVFSKEKVNFAYLLCKFISNELSKLKTVKLLNTFLSFLKTVVTELLFRIKTFITGLEIKITGNLRRKPRALSKTFNFGKKISKIKLNNYLEYYKSTSFSKKGTLGVKVWLTKTFY